MRICVYELMKQFLRAFLGIFKFDVKKKMKKKKNKNSDKRQAAFSFLLLLKWNTLSYPHKWKWESFSLIWNFLVTFLPKHFKGISRTRIWIHFCLSFSIFGLFVIHDIFILSSVGFAFEKCRARKSSYHLQFKFFQLNLRASYAN